MNRNYVTVTVCIGFVFYMVRSSVQSIAINACLHVCLCVRLCDVYVRVSQKPHAETSPNFLCKLPMGHDRPWLGRVPTAMQ